MLLFKEYKVLKAIKQTQDDKMATNEHASTVIFKYKINEFIKLEEYELNDILFKLEKLEYTCNLFNVDTKNIHCTEITDSGLSALKNFKKDYAIHIFKTYIWQIILIVLTAFLTVLFSK